MIQCHIIIVSGCFLSCSSSSSSLNTLAAPSLPLRHNSPSAACLNPSHAEATFVQSTRMQKSLKTIETLSCWYSLDSSWWVLSYEYPYARVSVIFQDFFHHFLLAKSATSSVRVNGKTHKRKGRRPLHYWEKNSCCDQSFIHMQASAMHCWSLL